MSTATNEIVLKVNSYYGQTDATANFAIAYLPMNAPDFQLYSGGRMPSIRIAIFMTFLTMFYHLPNSLTNVVEKSRDLQPKQLVNMLRLAGLTVKIQNITRYSVEGLFLVPTILIASLIGKYFATPYISYGVLLLMIFFLEI